MAAEAEELIEEESHFSKPIVYSPEVEQAISEVSLSLGRKGLFCAHNKLPQLLHSL